MKLSQRQISFVFMLLAIALIGFRSAHAQESIDKELPTRKTDRKVKEDTRKNDPNKNDIRRIYVIDGSKLLYGNPCALEATHALGFEYSIEHRDDAIVSSFWPRVWNNTKVKTRLLLTKGPFWKLMLNKRLKRCAKASGDFRG